MFQSRFFRQFYLKDIDVFHYTEVEEVLGSREASLLRMRTQMLRSEDFGAAVFVGGMEGVEREYELLAALAPAVPRFPVFTTGGAAQLLWRREAAEQPTMHPTLLAELRTKTSYASLFTDLLEEVDIGGE
jgi:hypothetical protein